MSAETQMALVVETLETDYLVAEAVAADNVTLFDWGYGEAKENWLYVSRRSIDSLKGEFRSDVLAGTRTLDWWIDFANQTHEYIRKLAVDIPMTNFNGRIEAATTEIVDDAKGYLKIGGLVLGAGTLLYLAVGGLFLYSTLKRARFL